MIRVVLAKIVFQLHRASVSGEGLFRKKLPRGEFLRFMANQPTATVVLEAFCSVHHWARELMVLRHEVKLIAPQYARPFVKR